MSVLELKVPPLLLVIIFAMLMWWVSLEANIASVQLSLSSTTRVGVLILAFIIGAGFAISGVKAFKEAQTTVNPTRPNTSSSLVTSGIYQYTRNPMYVGFLLSLLGWGIFLANLIALSLCMVFIWYMNRFQIEPEERALERLFGDEVLTYRQHVRRWV
ncbi:membrane protein, putative [Marinomonas sp. MED121]|uniref:methyltransferase family protein n=1 Tax=Marinomonas sp. MED121 TaxID=314277 RepID=UPI00006910EF|nr:isoprenylcysteine carboxylmethyltransferase family protein [Marinomonas sp. MED121]EAQ67432.1 membrane protein, putative [Marinomonas sp. MED121]